MIIYGTGFHASKFLTPMTVTGRDGVDLHEHWDGDARAYLGVTVPGFPNLFCLYGPNTNIVVNGSIVYFSECGVRYILGCLRLLLDGGHRALDVRKDVHDEFNERVDAENAHGLGLVGRQQLVQERARPRGPELAVHAARVLAAHPPRAAGRLRAREGKHVVHGEITAMKHRRLVAALFVGVLGVSAIGSAKASNPAPLNGTAVPGRTTIGLAQLLAAHAPADITTGIATLGAVPTATDVARLSKLGLEVQPMHQLPLAFVYGTTAAMRLAVISGAVHDVYPNEQLHYLDQASVNAMGGASVRAAGYTGKGVTVAVVDSGCDASHPDLADHVVHNVKLVGLEYANMPPDPTKSGDGAFVVPIDQGPYSNTDLGSGHGTHVAGIIAADGHTDPSHIGVAPDATLVCYSIGEVLFTTAVVTAYDHMLDQPDLWGIDVVNNSWGNSFEQFDPSNPVHVATKAVSDRGVLVVFAAGNSGTEDWEMTLNPFSEAPWVLSVAAEDLHHKRADFSSNGLVYDNSQGVAPGADGHTHFTGDRVGVYHPDVTAPGVDISSTCDTSGPSSAPAHPGRTPRRRAPAWRRRTWPARPPC